MMSGTLPPFVLYEDVVDLCDFREAVGLTFPRSKWVPESIAAKQQARTQAAIEAFLR